MKDLISLDISAEIDPAVNENVNRTRSSAFAEPLVWPHVFRDQILRRFRATRTAARDEGRCTIRHGVSPSITSAVNVAPVLNADAVSPLGMMFLA